MQIVFLGTSGSWPTPKRSVSAVAVKRGPEVLLFDCGEGTQRQFMLSKLSFMQVSRVFLSHFHGDHFLGLPGLVQSMSMNGREAPLDVAGPRGVERLVSDLLSLGYFTPGFPVRAKELPPGATVDCGEYVVRAFEAVHTVPGLSYVLEEKPRPGRFYKERALALGVPEGPLFSRLQEGEAVPVGGRTVRPEEVLGPPRRGRKIVYTGDSMPHDALVEMARGADVLIHDATSDAALEEKANRYGHSSSRQAAEVARKADVGLLVLTHLSPRYEDTASILADAAAVFDRVRIAEDFAEIDVPYPADERARP
jgi:ribonuclease Z